jgi:hypothetical protein
MKEEIKMKYTPEQIVESGGKRYIILSACAGPSTKLPPPHEGFEYQVQELNDKGEPLERIYPCFEEDIEHGTILLRKPI